MIGPDTNRQAGMTLVEVTISLGLTAFIVAIFSWATRDGLDQSAGIGGAAALRERGRRTMERMKRELGLIGRIDDGLLGLELPQVFADGEAPSPLDDLGFSHDQAEIDAWVQGFDPPPVAPPGVPGPYVAPRVETTPSALREIVFRVPEDRDGDGSIFDAVTGELEWSLDLVGYLMVPDGRGGFDLVRRRVDPNGLVADELMLRGIESMTFDLQETRGVLPLEAIELHLHLVDRDARGRRQRAHLATTIRMRNSP